MAALIDGPGLTPHDCGNAGIRGDSHSPNMAQGPSINVVTRVMTVRLVPDKEQYALIRLRDQQAVERATAPLPGFSS